MILKTNVHARNDSRASFITLCCCASPPAMLPQAELAHSPPGSSKLEAQAMHHRDPCTAADRSGLLSGRVSHCDLQHPAYEAVQWSMADSVGPYAVGVGCNRLLVQAP